MRNHTTRDEGERRNRFLTMPVALVLASLMVVGSMEIRDRIDRSEATTTQDLPEPSPASIPETTSTVRALAETSTSTTLAASIGERSLLASGVLYDGRGMRFERGRSAGVDCLSNDPRAVRMSKLDLPYDLGFSAISINPLVPLQRVVFLGQQTRNATDRHEFLSGGIAVGHSGRQLKIFDFKVEPLPGSIAANSVGTVVGQPSKAQLEQGLIYATADVTVKAQLNPDQSANALLSLVVQCK